MSMGYVLKSNCYGYNSFDGFYTGHIYQYDKEQYAVCSRKKDEIKVYTSRKRAEKACEKLNEKVVNYLFSVIEESQYISNYTI